MLKAVARVCVCFYFKKPLFFGADTRMKRGVILFVSSGFGFDALSGSINYGWRSRRLEVESRSYESL